MDYGRASVFCISGVLRYESVVSGLALGPSGYCSHNWIVRFGKDIFPSSL